MARPYLDRAYACSLLSVPDRPGLLLPFVLMNLVLMLHLAARISRWILEKTQYFLEFSSKVTEEEGN
jgi:hypothetical protein